MFHSQWWLEQCAHIISHVHGDNVRVLFPVFVVEQCMFYFPYSLGSVHLLFSVLIGQCACFISVFVGQCACFIFYSYWAVCMFYFLCLLGNVHVLFSVLIGQCACFISRVQGCILHVLFPITMGQCACFISHNGGGGGGQCACFISHDWWGDVCMFYFPCSGVYSAGFVSCATSKGRLGMSDAFPSSVWNLRALVWFPFSVSSSFSASFFCSFCPVSFLLML